MLKKGVKFSFRLTKPDQVTQDNFVELEKWRLIFYSMGLIGINRNTQMSFGNLSKKISLSGAECEIVITGSQTGQYPFLKVNQYTKLIKCDVDRLKVSAIGPTAPSNQSLLHYLVYKQIHDAKYVIIIEKDEIYDDFKKQNFPEIQKDLALEDGEIAKVYSNSNVEPNLSLILVTSSKKRMLFISNDIDQMGKYIMELNKKFKSS